jgi:hypothetical protein
MIAVPDSSDYDSITCRLAIQVRVGVTPGGRPSHRTFSIKGIKPDASISVLASLVRDAIAPLLAYPVTKARLITEKIRVLPLTGEKSAPVPRKKPLLPLSRAIRQYYAAPAAVWAKLPLIAGAFTRNILRLPPLLAPSRL